MPRTELHYMDAKSSKFWHIELTGDSHTVTYGRTGSSGQSKTKSFDTAEAAQKDYDKLVKAKLKKGYVAAATDDGNGVLPFIAFARAVKEPDNHEIAGTFIGERVTDYRAGTSAPVVRFRTDWDTENDVSEDLAAFLASPSAATTKGIVLGAWDEELFEESPTDLLAKLTAAADKLPNLVGLFISDIVQEECEISWLQQGDVSPVLEAFPQLELLRVRGGEGLEISRPRHANLRALALEAGGLSVDVVRAICTSEFPNLEYLELWLGTEDYGGTSSVQDLQPILSGALFPKLKYLGLRNCEYVDDVAAVIVNSPILDRIETLDLSGGTMTDEGGNALLSLPTGGTLKKVNLHHHWMSTEMMRKLQALPFTMEVGGRETDDEWRFVSVSE